MVRHTLAGQGGLMPSLVLSSGRARSALTAGMALAALTVLAIPANLLVHADGGDAVVRGAAAAFVLISGLDVVVAWWLWRLTNAEAPRTSAIAAVLRIGAGAIQGSAALALLTGGAADRAAVATFDERWSTSLLVFGLHLVVLAYVLARNAVPVLVVVATGAAGLAYLADSLPGAVQFLDSGVLMPFMFGELALLGWLLLVGRRSSDARRSALVGR